MLAILFSILPLLLLRVPDTAAAATTHTATNRPKTITFAPDTDTIVVTPPPVAAAEKISICHVDYDGYQVALQNCYDTYKACPENHPARPEEHVCAVGEEILSMYFEIFGGEEATCSVALTIQSLADSAAAYLEMTEVAIKGLCLSTELIDPTAAE